MDKTLLTNPSTYLLGFGIAALLGVWWARMNPTTGNLTLVVGVLAISLAAFLHPSIAVQPPIVRSFWGIATAAVLGLLAYYTLGVSPTPQVKRILLTPGTHPSPSIPFNSLTPDDSVLFLGDSGAITKKSGVDLIRIDEEIVL